MITPPIALAAFAAASIARAPAMATGRSAMKSGWSANVLAVLFVFSPRVRLVAAAQAGCRAVRLGPALRGRRPARPEAEA